MVLDVQDLWPDTIAVAGMRGCRPLAALLNPICNFVYGRAKAIVAQSPGMRKALIDRGVAAEKVTTIFNWADVPDDERGTARSVRLHPFTIVYGGNLGRAQALHTVVDAAAILEGAGRRIRIILYGDGVDATGLASLIADRRLSLISVEPSRPKEEITEILAEADALLIHLADEPLFRVTVPSKCQFYLALGRPIVAGIAGDGADILRASGSAIVVPPSDSAALAAGLLAMAETPLSDRERMGASGRRYYKNHFHFDEALRRTLALIEGAASVQAPAVVPAAA